MSDGEPVAGADFLVPPGFMGSGEAAVELAKTMGLVSTSYTSPPPNEPPSGVRLTSPAPIDPRLRAMLLTFRRALLMMADAVAAYCEIGQKTVR